MSQTNPKYTRLEALLSQAKPAAPDPKPQPLNGDVEALRVRVAELEAQLRSQSHSMGESSDAQVVEVASQVAVSDLAEQAKATDQDETGGSDDLLSQAKPATQVESAVYGHMTASGWMSAIERHVTDRTHDLELAAEVGRAISEMTVDVHTLLKQAVELIRERFGLYYTQIYLVDPAGGNLILRAGTGEVGAKLIMRGHQLPVGPGSLNGRAASEKRVVIVSNTSRSANFLPNPLLPNTHSEMVVPLIAGEKLVGVLDMQSDEIDGLSETNLPAYESLARQLAITIQNAALFAEVEEARSEVEAQVRRLTERGWQDFLDALERGHKVGFVFDQNRIAPLTAEAIAAGAEDALSIPISVTGTRVGAIQLKNESDRAWTAGETELVQAVSAQLSQQIENLRLLAQTERYREEAEQVVRRLTREGWTTLQAGGTLAPGYLYDLNEVKKLSEKTNGTQAASLKKPLVVRDETIGELVVDVGSQTDGAAEILAAVATQVSTHVETLRLTEEIQKRAAELEQLDRFRSAFLANMSHELRTPLNSILGFTDVMLEKMDGPLTENMNNDLQLIQKNGQHLLHLINDVLDMAKIEAGKMNLNPEQFKIHEIFEEVVSITSPLASEKALSLFVEEGSDRQVEVFADRTRIRQVMLNLVNNALKFTETGSIRIRAMRQDAKILISIRDTGVGIPADKLEAVFQEFTQVDTSATRKVGGTGLGLPISRRLVEMHSGRLWAESSGVPGEGSTFYVELPIEAKITEPVEKLTR
jgi:signal transduction histidine kinase